MQRTDGKGFAVVVNMNTTVDDVDGMRNVQWIR